MDSSSSNGPDNCQLAPRARTPAAPLDEIIVHVGRDDKRETFRLSDSMKLSVHFMENLRARASQGEAVELPDTEPDIFRDYMTYVLSNLMLSKPQATASERFTYLSKLYVLAGNFDDIGTKNTVIVEMVETAKKRYMHVAPLSDAVNIVYAGTKTDAMARMLLVDIFVDHAEDDWLGTWDAPKEFLQDLALQLLARRAPPSGDTVFTCNPAVYKEAF